MLTSPKHTWQRWHQFSILSAHSFQGSWRWKICMTETFNLVYLKQKICPALFLAFSPVYLCTGVVRKLWAKCYHMALYLWSHIYSLSQQVLFIFSVLLSLTSVSFFRAVSSNGSNHCCELDQQVHHLLERCDNHCMLNNETNCHISRHWRN